MDDYDEYMNRYAYDESKCEAQMLLVEASGPSPQDYRVHVLQSSSRTVLAHKLAPH